MISFIIVHGLVRKEGKGSKAVDNVITLWCESRLSESSQRSVSKVNALMYIIVNMHVPVLKVRDGKQARIAPAVGVLCFAPLKKLNEVSCVQCARLM